MIPGRLEYFEAFYYFVLRILSCVNTTQTKFGDNQTKTRLGSLISDRFTASDEAFALVMIDNYFEKWQVHAKTPKAQWKFAEAKYSSSGQGNKMQGWMKKGIEQYSRFCKMVEGRRADRKSVV